MSDDTTWPDADWPVLVPVEVLEGETVPDAVVEFLTPLPVVVLGYHVLPEQTPPGQARMQFEDQAQSKLDELAAAFRETGGEAVTRLVFTHDEEQTVDRVADETGCAAVLIPNPTGDVERLLVPVGGEIDVERVAGFVTAAVDGREVAVTLYHVAEDDDAVEAGRAVVESAADALREAGFPGGSITEEIEVSDAPVRSIGAAAVDHQGVVMGEHAPSLRNFFFGDPAEQVAERSLGPVVVVRRDDEPDGETEDGPDGEGVEDGN